MQPSFFQYVATFVHFHRYSENNQTKYLQFQSVFEQQQSSIDGLEVLIRRPTLTNPLVKHQLSVFNFKIPCLFPFMYLLIFRKKGKFSTFQLLPGGAPHRVLVFAHLKCLKCNQLSAKKLEDVICVHGNSLVYYSLY